MSVGSSGRVDFRGDGFTDRMTCSVSRHFRRKRARVCVSFQFHQLTPATASPRLRGPSAKIAAEARLPGAVPIPNSCSSRISTRCGVSTSRVSRNACNAMRALATILQRRATRAPAACWRRSAQSHVSSLSANRYARDNASNSSHFIAHFPLLLFYLRRLLPGRVTRGASRKSPAWPTGAPVAMQRERIVDGAAAQLRASS